MDTFYEGKERIEASANKHLMRWLGVIHVKKEVLRAVGVLEEGLKDLKDVIRIDGINEEYRSLNVLNYEMEAVVCYSKWQACTASLRPTCAE